MLIQRQMSLKKAACFAVYLILCTLAVVPAEEGEMSEEMFLNRLVDSFSGEIDEDTADLLWIHCRLDLMYKEYVGNLDTFLPQKLPCHDSKMNQNSGILAKYNIQKLLHIAHAELKQGLLNCLRESNIFRHAFREEIDSKSWYTKYLESLSPQSKYPKQNPRREVIAESAVSVLDPAPVNQSPHCSPTPSPDSLPLSPHVPRRYISESIPPPPKGKHSKKSGADSKKKKKKKHSSHISVITAIVITAVVTFVFVSLLFLCCAKLCKTGSHSRRSDERPLLSLSLSDYSMSSSVKSFALRNSIKGDIPSQQTVNANDVQNKKQSLNELLSLEDASKSSSARLGSFNDNNQASASALTPPPGHTPIKPPPGRADPLPPEPPTFLKPCPFTANPPCAPQTPAPVGPPPSQGVRASAPPPPPTLPSGSRPPPPPPMSSGAKPGAPPPPPPKGGAPPPRPPPPGPIGSKAARPPPPGTKRQSNTSSTQGGDPGDDDDAPKAKLKPFFWDKVQANPDQAMVWNQIKAGSFQFNEEMIETLFGYASTEKKKNEGKKESSSQEQMKYIQLIDSKKAQNLSILLRALNVTKEEVCDALQEGSELPAELLQTLLKMAPTTDEELKLRLYSGELSHLGPAERFLKALVDIPFAFKRLDALLFMCTVPEEVTITKESFGNLEVACNELRNSRLFLKLLEAVLKTGNRMNDGTFRGGAQAFKLDTLLKLSDVKGVDGKITLLHFVVQEIIRSEGIRAARGTRGSQSFSSIKSDDLIEETSHDTEEHYRSLGLQVVSSLGSQLENVRKAAALDADNITGTVAKLGHGLVKTRNFLNNEMNNLEEESEFCNALKRFVESSEDDVKWLLEEEKRIMALVKSTGDYFHGKAGRDEGLRIFVIVRDFLIMLDKTCKEVREASVRAVKSQKKEAATAPASSESHQATAATAQDLHRRFFPAIANQRMDYSSSDEDDT